MNSVIQFIIGTIRQGSDLLPIGVHDLDTIAN